MYLIILLVVSALGSRREERLANVLMKLLEGEEQVGYWWEKKPKPKKKYWWDGLDLGTPQKKTTGPGECLFKPESDPTFIMGSLDNHNEDCARAKDDEEYCKQKKAFCRWTGKNTIERVPLKAKDVMAKCDKSGAQCADVSSVSMFSSNCDQMCTPFLASGKYYVEKGSCWIPHHATEQVDQHVFTAVPSRSACFDKSEERDQVTAVQWSPNELKCTLFTGKLNRVTSSGSDIGRSECYQFCSYTDQKMGTAGTLPEEYKGCALPKLEEKAGCPAPSESAMTTGAYGCNGGCMNGNTEYASLQNAWVKCGEFPECTRVIEWNGKFLLRKANDTPVNGGRSIPYECSGAEWY